MRAYANDGKIFPPRVTFRALWPRPKGLRLLPACWQPVEFLILYQTEQCQEQTHYSPRHNRHQHTTSIGWLIFKGGSDPVPEGKREGGYDFRIFADAWFGNDDLKQCALCNSQERRIELCFQSKEDSPVDIELSFARDWDYLCTRLGLSGGRRKLVELADCFYRSI
jgi:hypothetical protein